MKLNKTPHPGKFIQITYINLFGYNNHYLAKKLDLSPQQLKQLLKGQAQVTADIAEKLSNTIGRSADSWLQMQRDYDFWQTMKKAGSANCLE
jgi:addiction module HigA family antidote